ncbi:hypothetical protein HK405_012285 [Cladochytrium tenue]|nr:hypothetical protein HK405_012285 [Cladochytrium tenue]
MAELDERDVQSIVDLQIQLATLISLRLVVRVSAEDRVESMKCKCNVNYSFASALAARMRFDLSKFLWDFQ